MTSALANALGFSAVAGLASFLGAALIFRLRRHLDQAMALLIAFAAGTLLAVAFLDLLPAAIELAGAGCLPYVLGSFIVFYFLENVLHYHSHHHLEPEHLAHHHPVGLIALVGMCFHSLIDGVIIGVGFEASPALGLVTTMGLLAHEIPQGIAVASILLHARYQERRALALSGLVAAATPVGALIAVALTSQLSRAGVGQMLAVAAGTFLYIAGADLIPESHAARQRFTGVMLLAGVLVVAAVIAVFHL